MKLHEHRKGLLTAALALMGIGLGSAAALNAQEVLQIGPYSGTFGNVREVTELNDCDLVQWSPSLTEDGLTVVFWRGTIGERISDLWIATREDTRDAFGTPELLTELNPGSNPNISPDGLAILFSSVRAGSEDIYMATRASRAEPFGAPVNLGARINTETLDEFGAQLSRDGRKLYFTRGQPPERGQILAQDTQLLVAVRPSVDVSWETDQVDVIPLDGANTPSGLANSSLSSDGEVLFFSEWVPVAQEDSDVSFATLDGDGAVDLTNPLVLPSPVNTTEHEFSPWLGYNWPASGAKLMFIRQSASDSCMGQQYLIYEATWELFPVQANFTVTVNQEQVQVDASDTTAEVAIVSYEWDFGDGETAEGVLANHTYTSAGRFAIQLTVTDEVGQVGTERQTVIVSCPTDAITPWTSADVGEPVVPGGAQIVGEGEERHLSVCASGKLLPASPTDEDRLHFVYQKFSGDRVLPAHILSIEGDVTSQVAVMFRESLDPGARHATMAFEMSAMGSSRHFYSREAVGGPVATSGGSSEIHLPNFWVRVERQADVFIGSTSTDGETWDEVDRVTLADFPDTYYGGVVAIGAESQAASFRALQAEIGVELEPAFKRADANADGVVDQSDAIATLSVLFLGEGEVPCMDAADSNDDGGVDISDALSTLSFLFLGEMIAPPGTMCGVDQTEDQNGTDLGCEAYPADKCQ